MFGKFFDEKTKNENETVRVKKVLKNSVSKVWTIAERLSIHSK